MKVVYLLKLMSLALTLLIFEQSDATAENQKISKAQITEMFNQINVNTDWQIEGKMLWGYFFFSSEQAHLSQISDLLSTDGYSVVSLHKSSASEWMLHVEMIEQHSVTTLMRRNDEFYALADQVGDVRYDGMDVGPAN